MVMGVCVGGFGSLSPSTRKLMTEECVCVNMRERVGVGVDVKVEAYVIDESECVGYVCT